MSGRNRSTQLAGSHQHSYRTPGRDRNDPRRTGAAGKKGERSYYKFDLDKSGHFQRDGPVGVLLRKANTKHEYADLEMLVDDFAVSKKHVNIITPFPAWKRACKVVSAATGTAAA